MIKQYFASFQVLSEQEIDALVKITTRRSIQKMDYLVREGDQHGEIAFIESGIFRSFYLSHKGEDITYCFRFPGDLAAAYSSFITGEGSVENIQSITPAEVLTIKKEALNRLVNQSANWDRFLKIIAEQQYLELEKRVFQLQKDSASERYISLMKTQPEYIQNIPLQYLASYLGITQRHLSRIRKELV